MLDSWNWAHKSRITYHDNPDVKNDPITLVSSQYGQELYVILDLCAKFQLSSMNRNVSRTPHPWSPYLEDVDGSWPETWRMGSFLTSLIILGDPQEVILKVSWGSDFIWLSYYSTNANIHMLRQKDPLFETHFHFG